MRSERRRGRKGLNVLPARTCGPGPRQTGSRILGSREAAERGKPLFLFWLPRRAKRGLCPMLMWERGRSRSPRGAFDRDGAEGHLRRREPFGDSGMRPRSEERERHSVARGGDRGHFRPGGRGPSPVRVERYRDLDTHRNVGGGSAMRGTGGGSYGLGDGRPMPSQRLPEKARAGDWMRCNTPNPAGGGGGIAGRESRPGESNLQKCSALRRTACPCAMPPVTPSPLGQVTGTAHGAGRWYSRGIRIASSATRRIRIPSQRGNAVAASLRSRVTSRSVGAGNRGLAPSPIRQSSPMPKKSSLKASNVKCVKVRPRVVAPHTR